MTLVLLSILTTRCPALGAPGVAGRQGGAGATGVVAVSCDTTTGAATTGPVASDGVTAATAGITFTIDEAAQALPFTTNVSDSVTVCVADSAPLRTRTRDDMWDVSGLPTTRTVIVCVVRTTCGARTTLGASFTCGEGGAMLAGGCCVGAGVGA